MKIEQAFGLLAVGLLTWGSYQLYQMNATLAVVTYKVEQNYQMIKPMWQDFLIRDSRSAKR